MGKEKEVKDIKELENDFFCDKTADKMAEFMKEVGIKAPKTRKERSKEPDKVKEVVVVGDEVFELKDKDENFVDKFVNTMKGLVHKDDERGTEETKADSDRE